MALAVVQVEFALLLFHPFVDPFSSTSGESLTNVKLNTQTKRQIERSLRLKLKKTPSGPPHDHDTAHNPHPLLLPPRTGSGSTTSQHGQLHATPRLLHLDSRRDAVYL